MVKKESKERRKRLLDAFKELTDVVAKIETEMEGVKHVCGRAQRTMVPGTPGQYIFHAKDDYAESIDARYLDEKGMLYRIEISKKKYKK